MNNNRVVFGIGLMALALAVFFWASKMRGRFRSGDYKHMNIVDSFSINDIKRLNADGVCDVVLIPSAEERVVFYYEKEEIQNRSRIEDSTLYLDFKTKTKGFFRFNKTRRILAKVYTNSINDIALSGVGSINAQGVWIQEQLTIVNDGVGSMELEVQAKDMDVSNSGVGSIDIKGIADNARLLNEGTGSIDAENLILKHAKVTNQGVGSISVQAKETLDMNNQGIGSIEYSGEAQVVSMHSEGIGSINKK